MSYNYEVLQSVLKSIAEDGSTENIYDQIERLTTDEIRKMKELFAIMDQAGSDKIQHMGE